MGINLLREGLDIPEVSLVAILDADKEGFLRSERSLIQTIGRAARNTEGKVIMYADELTDSMEKAISETNRRRKIQEEYNQKHGITPKTIQKSVRDNISMTTVEDISVEYKLEKNENIQDIKLKVLAIDGYTLIAQWILKQNDKDYDGIYEIKFNDDNECIYFKSWEMVKEYE